eukprot:12196034-Alexandrium_andersonii.AAC.1
MRPVVWQEFIPEARRGERPLRVRLQREVTVWPEPVSGRSLRSGQGLPRAAHPEVERARTRARPGSCWRP